ncbi:MAG: hypothetical protein HY648_08800 [Acidobacteria bacterium]|nr:hypothetical protein [Acidobacteriota bacterium]
MLESIILFVFLVLTGLASLGAIGWTLFSPVEVGVEKIFLLIVCLSVAALFLGGAAWMAVYSPLRRLWKPEKQAAPEAQKLPAEKQEGTAREAQKSSS